MKIGDIVRHYDDWLNLCPGVIVELIGYSYSSVLWYMKDCQIQTMTRNEELKKLM